MKRYLGSVATAVVLLVSTAVYPANTGGGGGSHGGGGFGGGGWHGGGGSGGWHGFNGHEFHDGGWHHGHDHDGFFFIGGGPFWWGYPYWWGPPYYYYDYYGYPPAYYYYDNPPTYYSGDYPPPYPQYDGRSYLTLGHDSGKALRLKTVSEDWLVEYLRAYIVNGPPSVRDDFRRGFVSGYGDGAEGVLRRATDQASQAKPRPYTAPPASTSGDPANR